MPDVLGPGPGPGPVGSGAASPQRGFFELTRQYGNRRLRKCDQERFAQPESTKGLAQCAHNERPSRQEAHEGAGVMKRLPEVI